MDTERSLGESPRSRIATARLPGESPRLRIATERSLGESPRLRIATARSLGDPLFSRSATRSSLGDFPPSETFVAAPSAYPPRSPAPDQASHRATRGKRMGSSRIESSTDVILLARRSLGM